MLSLSVADTSRGEPGSVLHARQDSQPVGSGTRTAIVSTESRGLSREFFSPNPIEAAAQ